MISILLRFLPKTRVSHPVSKLLRPVFEAKRIRGVVGGVIAATSIAAGAVYVPGGAQVEAMASVVLVDISTQKIDLSPLPKATGVSQGFHALHPGVDITAPEGTPIHPIMPGVVEMVVISSGGYGRHVMVRHNANLTSLYAHLGKVFVQEGDVVNRDSVLGEVGLTGHTTGYHLHLEIRSKGIAQNPLEYLRRL